VVRWNCVIAVAALNALAPTQTEPPFTITQATVLAIFILITLIAIVNSGPLELYERTAMSAFEGKADI
jgi:hypothetical protein